MQRQLIAAQDVNSLAILPEEFLYPTPFTKVQTQVVKEAAQQCRNLLQGAWEIPVYQIIYFLASSLNYDQGELATADKLAEKVNLQITGDRSRSSLITALVEIVNSERLS